MKKWGLTAIPVFLCLGILVVKAAQTNYVGTFFLADPTTLTNQLKVNPDGSINTNDGVAPAPVGVNPTPSAFTTSGTANTFTTAIAASSTRMGCIVSYQGTGTVYVYTGTGTAAENASQVIQQFGYWPCDTNGAVNQSQISVASTNVSDTVTIWVW